MLVGAGTVRADDPQLTVRLPGRQAARGAARPLRVVLAGTAAAAAADRACCDDAAPIAGAARGRGAAAGCGARWRRWRDRGIQSLLVEGGATIHGAFIAAGLVDRVALFFAPRLLGGGVPIARGAGLPLAKRAAARAAHGARRR